MNTLTSACAAGALLLASLAAASPAAANRSAPVPGAGGRVIYDGRQPPHCDANNVRLRHFAGDGHSTGHEHLGHGHKWSTKNFKGYRTKPPCYVRPGADLRAPASPRPKIRFQLPVAGASAAIRLAPSGDLS